LRLPDSDSHSVRVLNVTRQAGAPRPPNELGLEEGLESFSDEPVRNFVVALQGLEEVGDACVDLPFPIPDVSEAPLQRTSVHAPRPTGNNRATGRLSGDPQHPLEDRAVVRRRAAAPLGEFPPQEEWPEPAPLLVRHPNQAGTAGHPIPMG